CNIKAGCLNFSWSRKEKAAEAAGGIEKPRSTYYFSPRVIFVRRAFFVKRTANVSVQCRAVKLFYVKLRIIILQK
nr:hypothetical protein [Gammaproteobacteria bacterium]